MMYFVADSYKDYTYDEAQAYTKNNKLYVMASCKCSRCGGLGFIVSRIENNQLIPVPVDGGICYKCNGTKVEQKEIRLYTENEKAILDKATEKRKKAREEKQEETFLRDIEESEQNKQNWFLQNGFDPTGITYVVAGDSYTIKDKLKEAGFKYNDILGWHSNSIIELPNNCMLIPVEFSEVYEWNAHLKKGCSKIDAAAKIKALLSENTLHIEDNSQWVGEVGEKLNINASVCAIYYCKTKWGTSTLITFNADGNILVWMTSTDVSLKAMDKVNIVGVVKEHNTYKDIKQTILTRCKVCIIE